MNNIVEHTSSKVSDKEKEKRAIMEAVDSFKSVVLRIRDILRGPGMHITGMDSMRTICIYLMARYITRERAISIGIPDRYSWCNIMDQLLNHEGGKQYALNLIYDENEDDDKYLIGYFDRIFGTDDFQFKVKNLDKHAEILKLLNGVSMEKVDCHMDILGWVYEQHLKTGSSSSSRDLGQFFTDRIICDYMTKLCNPVRQENGDIEEICDPTMGTGGFLTSIVKHYRTKYEGIDWNEQQRLIHGCDVDPRVCGVSKMNMFMESQGHIFENLSDRDTLYGELPQEEYDVILANMPFGSKGIVYKECNEQIRKLKIKGTKSEPLFLQLMSISLKKGGRCAVVVPDGMLVNTTKLHVKTRKYLIEHLNLKRVIKMKGKYFMNTSIEPSILYFERNVDGKTTEDIEFWEVIRREDDKLVETMEMKVHREELNAEYSLDMRRYQIVEEATNAKGYPMVELGEVCEFKNGFAFKSKELTKTGDIPILKISNISNGIIVNKNNTYISKSDKYKKYEIVKNDIIISLTGYVGDIGINQSSDIYYLNQRTAKIIIKTATLCYRYLYYYLLCSDFKKQVELLAGGSAQPNVSTQKIKTIKIPLPPLDVQKQIVETLDRIYHPGTSGMQESIQETLRLTDQTMNLVLAQPDGSTLEPIVHAQELMRKQQQMVADLRQQMVAIVDGVKYRGFDKVELGKVCEVKNGNRITKTKDKGTKYPVYGSGGITFYTDDYNREGITCKVGRFAISEKSMVSIVKGKYWLNDSGFTVKSKNENSMLTMYLWNCLLHDKKRLSELSSGSCQNNIIMKEFYKFKIPLPPLEFQTQLVDRLEKLQLQIDALEEYQAQVEDNAKFMLESYLGGTTQAQQ